MIGDEDDAINFWERQEESYSKGDKQLKSVTFKVNEHYAYNAYGIILRPEDETTGIFDSGDFEGLGEIKFNDHTIVKAHFTRGVWSSDKLVSAVGK